MSRRVLAAVAVAAFVFAPSLATRAAAQESDRPDVLAPVPSFLSSFGPSIRLADLELPDAEQRPQSPIPQQVFQPRRNGPSPIMLSLYASTAVVHALDVHSTLQGLEQGAYEANPIMAPLTKNKFVFIGVKAAVAAGTIYATREMAKKNKVAAIITLVAINSAYAYVAHHNYRVADRLR